MAATPSTGLDWVSDAEGTGSQTFATSGSSAAAPSIFNPAAVQQEQASFVPSYSPAPAPAAPHVPTGPGLEFHSTAAGVYGQPPAPVTGKMATGAGTYAGAAGMGPDWYDPDDMENEPPLLKELGVDLSHIQTKLLAVVDPRSKVNMEVVQDGDIFGPLFIWLGIGLILMLRGQFHFGPLYSFGLVGCLGMYLVLNLMATGPPIGVASVFGIFGYGLLPIAVLAGVSVVVSLSGALGMVIAPLCIGWSTWCATRFFEAALGMDQQRALIAYPTFLLYAVFALVAVF